jgi:hypothetical protein
MLMKPAVAALAGWILASAAFASGEIPTSVVRTVGEENPFLGQTFVITVELEGDDPELAFGSYAALLEWDPNLCVYQWDEPGNGTSGLSDPVVNLEGVGEGRLRFSAADAHGASGRVELLRIGYLADGTPGDRCTFTPSLSSLYEAGSYQDILGGIRSEVGEIVQRDPRHSLGVEEGGPGTFLNWIAVPGAESYDVIRGDLAGIGRSPDEPEIDLGGVVCIENDSVDTTTAGGHEDPLEPLPGECLFYLFRVPGEPYGESSAGESRKPTSGDCLVP